MNLVEWYSEDRAATALGVSTRTIRRMAQEGTLRRAWRPVQGRKPEATYHPEDVEREAAKTRRPTPVEDTRPAAAESLTVAVRPGIGVPEALERFGELLRRGPRQAPPLWLTIEQASEHSGLSQALLHRLIASGQLAAIGDAAIKVRRADVEQLDATVLSKAAPLEALRGRTRGIVPQPKAIPPAAVKKSQKM